MTDPIAVLATACRFAGAATPGELWRDALDGRRSFRAVPRERLDLSAYAASAVGDADSITPVRAGLLTDWRFDRARFRIPSATYESTDLAHWLALDVAADAVDRAGGPARFDPDRTAVIVANTLTGEFSRAAQLRLRLPFLDGALRRAIDETGLSREQADALRAAFARDVRDRLGAPTEEMLSGGLANTIAGRIANYFGFRGGAYLVDAACASSLVAVANAASAIASGELDAVVVAAVDLSLDPFELVGFSRNGALAREDMRVFDARAEGFWPGEGAGAVVLMAADAARSSGAPIVASLRGWGITTDGHGGMTRPSVDGQARAIRLAQRMARLTPDAIAYVEAHGTGTPVGDEVELRALAEVWAASSRAVHIGSIKANIGHTKAAAGMAGLIKTIEAVTDGVIPPHVGCETPHALFARHACVRVTREANPWPDGPRLAGVSAFGFGGTNAHVVVAGPEIRRRAAVAPLAPMHQDCELFVFAGDRDRVSAGIDRLIDALDTLSTSELADAAATLASEAAIVDAPTVRVAIVARDAAALRRRLELARERVAADLDRIDEGVFVGRGAGARIGFLFPGQGAPAPRDAGGWRHLGDAAAAMSGVPSSAEPSAMDTAFAQPSIVAASLAALRLLRQLGIDAVAACGHSLGEIGALCWSGALGEADVVPLAIERGRLMAAADAGAMVRVAADASSAVEWLRGLPLVLACENGPAETVIAGPTDAVAAFEARARANAIDCMRLPIGHAFHSPSMRTASLAFDATLTRVDVSEPVRRVFSTVTGALVPARADLRAVLRDQFVTPVRFASALAALMREVDLLVEVGPGHGLSRLARDAGARAISVDACASSLEPLLSVVGEVFVRGVAIDFAPLFARRACRPIDLTRRPFLLSNPCGGAVSPQHPAPSTQHPAPSTQHPAPSPQHPVPCTQHPAPSTQHPVPCTQHPAPSPQHPLSLVVAAVSARTGLPASELRGEHRFLDDLHLSSLAVARIVADAARLLDVAAPRAPTELANATLAELAATLADFKNLPLDPQARELVYGVRRWIRPYAVEWRAAPPVVSDAAGDRAIDWAVVGIGESAAPVEPEASGAVERGVLLWIDDEADETIAAALLTACQTAARDATIQHLAICHAGAPVSAFARSIAQERRFRSVRVLHRPRGVRSLDALRSDLRAPSSEFDEIRIESDGQRLAPSMAPVDVMRGSWRLGADDVVLVTGGAKGIGAECAARLAQCSGAAVALVGRTAGDSPDVRRALDRLDRLGVRYRYRAVDAADVGGMTAFVADVTRELGAVTVLLHAAGVNEPRAFDALSAGDLAATLAPKIDGLRASVAAVGAPLRRVITFGSIIGRTGLAGEAHYALANAWQTAVAAEIARTRPDVSVLALEWSVWSGTGMGERTGAIERLAAQGVTALSIDDALEAFETLALGGAEGAVVVTGRFGPPPFVSLGDPALPLGRFVDAPRLHYPDVELVLETELSLGRDPYLADHRVDGAMVWPGVLALEAMAQAAAALTGRGAPQAAADVEFLSAIVVPDTGGVRIRIATLREGDRVEAVVRASDDGFAAERMRAVFEYGAAAIPPLDLADAAGLPGCDAAPLYGSLFFHAGRFRRLAGYSAISARYVRATTAPASDARWFGSYESQAFVLGDPGARDALLHAAQAAVPQHRVLPVGVHRIVFGAARAPLTVDAVEREATRDTFVFDIVSRDAAGDVVELWESVTFRAVSRVEIAPLVDRHPALAGAYLERLARAHLDDPSIFVALVHEPGSTRECRRSDALHALGLEGGVVSRADGKPEMASGMGAVSISHHDALTLVVTSRREIACDLEGVTPTSTAEADASSTRAWTTHEVAYKLGCRGVSDAIARPTGEPDVAMVDGDPRVVTVGPLSIGGVRCVVAIGTRVPAAARSSVLMSVAEELS